MAEHPEDDGPDWRDRLEALHPPATIAFFAGLLLWPATSRRLGLGVAAAAVVVAGLIPMITGEYRTRMAYLHGARARIRGLISVLLGAFLLTLALA